MRRRNEVAALLIGLSTLVIIAARLQPAVGAQTDPFPTVPAPDVTFPAPIFPVGTAVSAFGTVDGQPEYDLAGRLRDASGYLAGGVVGLAIGGAAYWLAKRADRATEKSEMSVAGGSRPRSGRFTFSARLRRISWLAPSAAGLVLLAMAGSRCVPSKLCYANAGGVQIAVPCDEVEGQAEAQLTPTATPGIDCPDPGRGGTNAYEVARAGGRHSGYLDEAIGYSDASLRSALRSFELQVAEHISKMANPALHTDNPWDGLDSREQRGTLSKWCADMNRNRELAEVIIGVMKERGIEP